MVWDFNFNFIGRKKRKKRRRRRKEEEERREKTKKKEKEKQHTKQRKDGKDGKERTGCMQVGLKREILLSKQKNPIYWRSSIVRKFDKRSLST